MKVFIVTRYVGDVAKILKVYADVGAAQEKITRLELRSKDSAATYHLVTKTVTGLHGIKFEIDGKVRSLVPYGKLLKRGK